MRSNYNACCSAALLWHRSHISSTERTKYKLLRRTSRTYFIFGTKQADWDDRDDSRAIIRWIKRFNSVETLRVRVSKNQSSKLWSLAPQIASMDNLLDMLHRVSSSHQGNLQHARFLYEDPSMEKVPALLNWRYHLLVSGNFHTQISLCSKITGCIDINMATVSCSPLPHFDSLSILASQSRHIEEDCHQRFKNNSTAAPGGIRFAQLHFFNELSCVRHAVSFDNDADRSRRGNVEANKDLPGSFSRLFDRCLLGRWPYWCIRSNCCLQPWSLVAASRDGEDEE